MTTTDTRPDSDTAVDLDLPLPDRLPDPAWVDVCDLSVLVPERGVAALVHGQQVAIYRLHADTVCCIGNTDPFSGANVLSRGIVGTREGADVVASPLYKQHFDLRTGVCQEDPARVVPVHEAMVRSGRVLARLSSGLVPAQELPQQPSRRPLEGYLIGITADRRKNELATLLQRKGARTAIGTAITLVPLADDTELLRATERVLAREPTHVVVTTGIGFRGWAEAADGWGLGDRFRQTLGQARILARGPKATGAIRANDLREEWSAASEASAEVLERLLAEDLTAARVAVQLHGEPLPFLTEALQIAGAEVIEVPVYRWSTPEDVTGLDALVHSGAVGTIDALTFTSAPAVVSVLRRAEQLGVRDQLVARLRTQQVLACCVGPVTAGPLTELEVPTAQPERFRLGAMVRHIVEALPARDQRPLRVAGHTLVVLATGVLLAGAWRDVRPTQQAVLRALAERPGHVLSRAELAAALPGCGDEHAIEMAVARLRSSLGDPRIVQTVVKRGYRLAYDPDTPIRHT